LEARGSVVRHGEKKGWSFGGLGQKGCTLATKKKSPRESIKRAKWKKGLHARDQRPNLRDHEARKQTVI
jgi:hypothetical protein